MEDLFEREQKIHNNAVKYIGEVGDSIPCAEIYSTLVKEYGRLLKHLRRVTKISDKTTTDLNTSKLDLLDKVHYDPLTGIYNRRFMDENLKRVIKSLNHADEEKLSILMIDVDSFKKYNDMYGHGMGDTCLRAVAGAISRSIKRAGDFVARYGGEEFAIVLSRTDENGACEVARKAIENVRSCRIPHNNSDAAEYVTISVGVTTGVVKDTINSKDFLSRADEALYISKKSGRNRYTYIDFECEATEDRYTHVQ